MTMTVLLQLTSLFQYYYPNKMSKQLNLHKMHCATYKAVFVVMFFDG